MTIINQSREKATITLVQRYSKDLRDKHAVKVKSLKLIYLVDFDDIWDILNNTKISNIKSIFLNLN